MNPDRDSQREVRSVLIPLARGRLLLPAVAVAEVIGYRDPDAMATAPDWLMGSLFWQQWRIPLIRFERAVGQVPEAIACRARVIVCKAIGETTDLPYLAILAQANPRLIRISEQVIAPEVDPQPLDSLVMRQVRVNDESAWIPDLDLLAHRVAELWQSQ